MALPETVWVISRPSGRGIPLRAGSPRCCSERRPGSGSPHPPAGVRRSASAWGDSPKRSGLARAAAAHTSGAPPQGRVFLALTASPGLPGSDRGEKEGARSIVALAGLMRGVAWLIPYCARPASTAHSDRHLKSILVRDARARGISLAAPPLGPSSAEAAFPSSLYRHESRKSLFYVSGSEARGWRSASSA